MITNSNPVDDTSQNITQSNPRKMIFSPLTQKNLRLCNWLIFALFNLPTDLKIHFFKQRKAPRNRDFLHNGGQFGIRTQGRRKPSPVFKTGALNQLDQLSKRYKINLHHLLATQVNISNFTVLVNPNGYFTDNTFLPPIYSCNTSGIVTLPSFCK